MKRLLVLASLVLAACGSTGTNSAGDGGGGEAPPRPWTGAFGEAAVLLADAIVVEGPRGLVEHIAVRQDTLHHEYSVQTTRAGLQQTTKMRGGIEPVEIRAQLDGWQLVALESLVVLERPGDVPVIVRARGDAVWREVNGEGERRGQELTFRGDGR